MQTNERLFIISPSKVCDRDRSDMATAETFFELLDSDLRLLSSEARKLDGFAQQISGLFAAGDAVGPIKDSCERALTRLRGLASGGKSMEGIRQTPVRQIQKCMHRERLTMLACNRGCPSP